MLEVAHLNTDECFPSFRLAEETILGASSSPEVAQGGGVVVVVVGHLRLRSAADMLAFTSPSSGLRAYCRKGEVAELCPPSAGSGHAVTSTAIHQVAEFSFISS